MPLELILSQKNSPLLIHENYIYNIHREAVDKVTWRCKEYKNYCTIRCHTTSKKPEGRIIYMTPGEHNHSPDTGNIEARKIVNSIRKRARTTKERTGLIVANAVAAASPAAVASLPDLKCLVHTVQRNRGKKPQNSKIKDPVRIMERASPEQLETLVEFIEGHTDSTMAGVKGRKTADRYWESLGFKLNATVGGIKKPVKNWKDFWAYWKTETEKKALLNRRHARNGSYGGQSLTPLEERVLGIIEESADAGQGDIEDSDITSSRSSESLDEPSQSVASGISEDSEVTEHGRLEETVVCDDSSEGSAAPPSPPPPRAAPAPRRPLAPAALDHAASRFAALERRRLSLEETRERNMHERETERLRLETQRIEVFRRATEVGEALLGHLEAWSQSVRDANGTARHARAVRRNV